MPNEPSPDDLLSIGEVAGILHCSHATVRRWADGGHLRHVRTPGGQRRFRRSDVEALLAPTEPAA